MKKPLLALLVMLGAALALSHGRAAIADDPHQCPTLPGLAAHCATPTPSPSPTPSPRPTASPTPTPAPTPTPVAGAPYYDGCPIFSPSDPSYNVDISAASPDPNSSQYIAGLGSTQSWDFDTAEVLNTANSLTPILSVGSKVKWHTMNPEPWEPSYVIEDFSDAHSFVFQDQTCHTYELYSTTYSGGVLSAYSGDDWSTTGNFNVRGNGASGPNASGTSMFAGAVKYSEFAGGINHALLLIVPYNMLAQWQYVSPASSTDGIPYDGPGPMALPYGAKLRLRSDFPTTGFGSQALAVVHALQTYGAIVSDTGCCYKLIFMHDYSTPDAFNFTDLNHLKNIRTTDWTVAPALGTIYTVPGH